MLKRKIIVEVKMNDDLVRRVNSVKVFPWLYQTDRAIGELNDSQLHGLLKFIAGEKIKQVMREHIGDKYIGKALLLTPYGWDLMQFGMDGYRQTVDYDGEIIRSKLPKITQEKGENSRLEENLSALLSYLSLGNGVRPYDKQRNTPIVFVIGYNTSDNQFGELYQAVNSAITLRKRLPTSRRSLQPYQVST